MINSALPGSQARPCFSPVRLHPGCRISVQVHDASPRRLVATASPSNTRTTVFTSTMQERPEPATSSESIDKKKHLVVMANGLFGKASNWDVVIENLQKVLDTSQTLLVASDANSLMQVGLPRSPAETLPYVNRAMQVSYSTAVCVFRHLMASTAVETG